MSPEALARLREAVRVFDLDSIEHDPIVSFDDLRALLDAYDTARAEHARGVAEERARIVADLRAEAKRVRGDATDWVRAEAKRVRGDATDWVRHAVARKLELRADRYERGDHLKEESDD